jgi:hypothetical protein
MHPFRAAIERGDEDGAMALLDPQVRFRSPAVHRPYEGFEAVSGLLRLVVTVFEDFSYTDELTVGNRTVLFFRARVGDRELEGLDDLTMGPDGTIIDFRVMVRPLSGLIALAEEMGARLSAAEPS